MVIDSSAVLAILLNEPEEEEFLLQIQKATDRYISAASYLEAGMVLRRDPTGQRLRFFEYMLRAMRIQIASVSEQQARIALQAFTLYGKGQGHPAGLNYGDCFSYALAKTLGEPLLFKGNDFSHTDLHRA